MEASRKELMKKERKSLRSRLTTLLRGWALRLSPLALWELNTIKKIFKSPPITSHQPTKK